MNPNLTAVGVWLIVLVCAVTSGTVPDHDRSQLKGDVKMDTLNMWMDKSVPFQLKVWFFHITNPEEFMDSPVWDVTPIFREVGPYVFSERRVKYDIHDGDDDTIYYRQNITYEFSPELSGEGLDEDDYIIILNIPLITVLTLLDVNPRLHFMAHTILQSLLTNGETLFMQVKVSDVLFDGVQLDPVYKTVETLMRTNGIPLPDEILNGYFAFYREKNGLNSEGEWRMYKGIEDPSKFNVIKSINDGKTRLEPWWVDHCAMINGTDGTIFPPLIEKETRLYIYIPEMCRSIFLDFDEEIDFEDIHAYRFRISDEMFANPAIYKPNECFCMPLRPPLNNSCSFSGLNRLFSCKANAPFMMGKPHFLHADPGIIADGMRYGLMPDAELHDTYFDIEPHSGFLLRMHKRLQFGVEIQQVQALSMAPFNTIPHRIYPVFWTDEQMEMDETTVQEIRDELIKR